METITCKVTLASDGRVLAYEDVDGILIDATTGVEYELRRKSWNMGGAVGVAGRVSLDLMVELQSLEAPRQHDSDSSEDVVFVENQGTDSMLEQNNADQADEDEYMQFLEMHDMYTRDGPEMLAGMGLGIISSEVHPLHSQDTSRAGGITAVSSGASDAAVLVGDQGNPLSNPVPNPDILAKEEAEYDTTESSSFQIIDAYYGDLESDQDAAVPAGAKPVNVAQEHVDILCTGCSANHNPEKQIVVDLCSGCDRLFCNNCSCWAMTREGQQQLVCKIMCRYKLMDVSAAISVSAAVPKKTSKLSRKAGMFTKRSPRSRSESEGGGAGIFVKDLLMKRDRNRSNSESSGDETMHDLLMDDKDNAFTYFLQSEGAAAMATFFRMSERLKLVDNELERLLIGARMYHLFVKEGGEKQIKISPPEVSNFLSAYFAVPRNVFDGAQSSVLHDLEQYYARFRMESQSQSDPARRSAAKKTWRKRALTPSRKDSVSALTIDLESSVDSSTPTLSRNARKREVIKK